MHIAVHPILAGTGSVDEMLFRSGNRAKLSLVNTRALGTGVVILGYEPIRGEG
ncbi:MAG: hypothetical protein ACRDWA_16875 [Acidimicrobiia bacterium]